MTPWKTVLNALFSNVNSPWLYSLPLIICCTFLLYLPYLLVLIFVLPFLTLLFFGSNFWTLKAKGKKKKRLFCPRGKFEIHKYQFMRSLNRGEKEKEKLETLVSNMCHCHDRFIVLFCATTLFSFCFSLVYF